MTVRKLMTLLSQYPASAEVGWQDHDASEGEISSHVRSVSGFTPDGTQSEDWTRGVKVIIKG
jgi:hypothetical protein